MGRLVRKSDFDRLLRRGIKVYGKGISARVMAGQVLDAPTKIGFLIGAKYSKRSVVRNRIRRQLREILRGLYGRMKPGFLVSFTAFPEAQEMTTAELAGQVEKVLVKGKVL